MRIIGLDALRGLALILMFITHTFRIIHGEDSGLSYDLFKFFMLIEPFTAALFLILVGISLTFKYEKNPTFDYLFLKRMIYFYIISALLFIMEFGFQISTLLLSSGILFTITVSSFLVMLVLNFSKKIHFIIILLFLIFYYKIETLNILGLTAGPGGIFPLAIYSLIGSFLFRDYKNNAKFFILALISVIPYFIFKISLILKTSITFLVPLKGEEIIYWINPTFHLKTFKFWNISFSGFFLLLLPLFLFIGLSLYQRKENFLNILGKNSLILYVSHLLIIGALSFLKIKSYTTGWVIVFLLVLAGLFLSKNIKSKKR